MLRRVHPGPRWTVLVWVKLWREARLALVLRGPWAVMACLRACPSTDRHTQSRLACRQLWAHTQVFERSSLPEGRKRSSHRCGSRTVPRAQKEGCRPQPRSSSRVHGRPTCRPLVRCLRARGHLRSPLFPRFPARRWMPPLIPR